MRHLLFSLNKQLYQNYVLRAEGRKRFFIAKSLLADHQFDRLRDSNLALDVAAKVANGQQVAKLLHHRILFEF